MTLKVCKKHTLGHINTLHTHIKNVFIKMLSGRNDKFINVKCLQSLCFYSRGSEASLSACLALSAQSHCNLVNTRHASIHQNATNWRELWPRDASIWKTRQLPLYLSLPKSVFSNTQLSISHIHTQPTVFADWQELQTVGHHRLHFRRATRNWQPTDGWLLAGNTCSIYQPAGVYPVYYAYDMDNFEVYLNGFRH